MTGLRKISGDKIIADRVAAGRPVLGVCVGMQILFARGVEFGVETHRLRAVAGRRRPAGRSGDPAHGLECRRRAAPGTTLFKGIDADTRFYFVHSYAAQQWEGRPDALLTWATHHVPFLAAVEDGPLCRHPVPPGEERRRRCRVAEQLGRSTRLTDVPLILLPAVDVVDGKAVRLVQGQAGSETEYGSALDAAHDLAARRRRVDPPRRPRRRVRSRLQPRTARRGGRQARRRGRAVRRHPRRRVADRGAGHRLRAGQPRHRGAGEPAVVRQGDRRARRSRWPSDWT